MPEEIRRETRTGDLTIIAVGGAVHSVVPEWCHYSAAIGQFFVPGIIAGRADGQR